MTLPSIASQISNEISSLLGGFSLEQLEAEGFPLQKYNEQLGLYEEYEEWYQGKPLNVTLTDKKTGKVVEKYPIKINPIKRTCKAHAARVIGQNTDSIRFAGLPFRLLADVKEDKKEVGEKVEEALLKVFAQNGFGASFLSTCIRSQYLGGAILASKWLPAEKLIEITTPSPKEVLPIPDGSNYNVLREAWIVKEITELDALALGYRKKSLDSKFYYIEHWTKADYKIQVNNQVLTLGGIEQKGPNPYGRVPIVYIPHIRIDSFYGDSIITETVHGVIKELNLRWADIGDAVSDDAHDYVAVRNVSGSVTTINVGDDRPVLDLGNVSGIGGTNAEPDMFAIGTKSASEPMLKFVDNLYQEYRRETNHPAVADGEDEGSQRSSLTLAVRMAPLVDEAEFERLFWTIGLLEFAKILLTIMKIKDVDAITDEMIEMPLIAQWQPMLPRDREAMSTEAAVRSKNHITSNKRLNQMFGDVPDVDEDEKQIEKEAKALAEIEAKAKPPVQPFGGGGARPQPNQPKQTPGPTKS